MNRAMRRFLTLGSVGDVVTQQRPPQASDFGGGGLRSPIYINGLTGEAFIYLNGAITALGQVVLIAPVLIGATGQVIANAKIVSAGAGNLVGAGGAFTDVWLRALNLANTAASPNGNGVQINVAGCSRWGIVESTIAASFYGVLANSQAGGSKGLIVGLSFITSAAADCVTINSPVTAIEDVIVTGNVLNVTAGSGVSAGFAVALAHVNGALVMGNVSQRSFLEAHHIEDGSKNVAFIGNVSKSCMQHGLNHIIDGANSAQAKAAPIIGNTYEAPAITGTGYSGIRVAWTGTGSVNGEAIIGNVVRNFDYGISLGSVVQQIANGNVIDNCTFAIRVDTSARVSGTNQVLGASSGLLFVGLPTGNDVRVGKFLCDTKPAAIIVKAAPGTTRPGCSVEGFSWPQPNAALANGANQVNLFAVTAGTRVSGKIRVVAFNQAVQADNVWYCADALWDGTTLTLANVISEVNGNLSLTGPPALTVSGGQLRVGLSSVGAMTAQVEVDFDGIYML